MSPWTHAICIEHWNKRRPESPVDSANVQGIDPCCWCGRGTNIYVRDDPVNVPCTGVHKDPT